jgi:hypothetical protein
MPAVPADRDAQPSAFGHSDNAGVELRTLLLLWLARRWRGAARQSAWQADLDGTSANSDVVPSPGEMPVILEVFCGLLRGLAAAVLPPDSVPAGARWARQLGWRAALDGPAVAALCCDFIATNEGADFWNFAQAVLGLALL